MKKYQSFIIALFCAFILSGCANLTQTENKSDDFKISEKTMLNTTAGLIKKYPSVNAMRVERGIQQVASLWRAEDGSEADFISFCEQSFIFDQEELSKLYDRLERNYEIIDGYMLKMELLLKEPIDMDWGKLKPIDYMFGTFNPSAHITADFYANKIAFVTALNFPNYSLAEKSANADKWSRREWAYARMGDKYTARVPAEVIQEAAKTFTMGDAYISSYNIFMGNLIGDDGQKHFPKDLSLITHWGLRDELKSNYFGGEEGMYKQEMVYAVMKNIIYQSIPEKVINSSEFDWNPFDNSTFKDGKKVELERELDKRYEVLLSNFHAQTAFDEYNPGMPTYIQRRFEDGMEIAQEDVENIFTDLVSSPIVKDVAKLIESKLGRKLRPFDIWYTGFAGRSSMTEEQLDEIIKKKYPTAKSLENDLPNLLKKLGFKKADAKRIAALIRVDDSRGIGHAWGSSMRNEKARLRTRVQGSGMTYKGYNIAVHEFGHNVEQTITMNDVDYYMMNGVPNTAITEALAFIFQKRDLELLGIKEKNPEKMHLMALDNFWSCYEIMGVSLVDMNVWKWLYANPKATKEQLKEAVIRIAKEIWNKYYAEIFGSTDEPILAIYSHMIDNPLYLSAYPMGHVVDFQIEQQLEGRDFAKEIFRIYTQGVYVPQYWMQNAVGNKISTEPLIKATKIAVEKLK